MDDLEFEVQVDREQKVQDLQWQNRRKIAWRCLYFVKGTLVLLFILAMVDAFKGTNIIDNVSKFSEVIISVIIGFVGLIGGYMGLASVYGSTNLNLSGKFSELPEPPTPKKKVKLK